MYHKCDFFQTFLRERKPKFFRSCRLFIKELIFDLFNVPVLDSFRQAIHNRVSEGCKAQFLAIAFVAHSALNYNNVQLSDISYYKFKVFMTIIIKIISFILLFSISSLSLSLLLFVTNFYPQEKRECSKKKKVISASKCIFYFYFFFISAQFFVVIVLNS